LAELITVGTKENQAILNCAISPNPVSNALIVNCSNELVGKKYTILNVLGEAISTDFLTNNATQIDVNQLANGLYFFNVNGTCKTLKFVKE
jgi:Secretion system C-terminal sorting domain